MLELNVKHILNVVRALPFQGCLPIDFWGECVLTAAYLINRTPSRVLKGKTPYELLLGKAHDLSSIRVFGCLCYAKNLNRRDKSNSRSRRCIFLGYPFGKKGWHLFDLETGDYFQSRDVKFFEDIFPLENPIELKCLHSLYYDDTNLHNEDVCDVNDVVYSDNIDNTEQQHEAPSTNLNDISPTPHQHSLDDTEGDEYFNEVVIGMGDPINLGSAEIEGNTMSGGGDMNMSGDDEYGRGKREKFTNTRFLQSFTHTGPSLRYSLSYSTLCEF